MKIYILSSIISLAALSACGQSDTSDVQPIDTKETTVQEVSESQIKTVSKSEFKAFLSDHQGVQLIDVRTPAEFSGGAIEGAKNIDYLNQTFETEINKLDKNKPVLIYCKSGGRSARALEVFRANGFTHVLELAGGYSKW